MASKKRMLKLQTNLEWLNERCRELGNKIVEIEDSDLFGEAYFYSFHSFKQSKFKPIVTLILNTFIYGEHKKRWTGLISDYGSGKTTFPSAIMKLFDGIMININVPQNRLALYVDSAIGKRFVLLDGVKGKRSIGEYPLQKGEGFENLDDLRSQLDGKNPVQLERKNVNPVMQIFRAGIITCKKYQNSKCHS